MRFSPRNGEVILKSFRRPYVYAKSVFQSPQWGSNSKEYLVILEIILHLLVSVPAMGK